MFDSKKIFIGAALTTMAMFASENGALVVHQQPSLVCKKEMNTTVETPLFAGNGKALSSKTRKKISQPADYLLPQQKILERAAQQEIDLREHRAKPMSDYINQKYIGEDDSWSFMNLLITRMGFSDYWHSSQSAVKALTEIYHYFEPQQWTQPTITALFCPDSKSYNGRIYNLLNRLILQKKYEYQMFPAYGCGCPALKGSTIDEFFDEAFLFPDLPKPFQVAIQRAAETHCLNFCMPSAMPELSSQSTKFLILLAALRNCKEDAEELKSFFTSSTLQKHEKETDFAFTRYIKNHENMQNIHNHWETWNYYHCK